MSESLMKYTGIGILHNSATHFFIHLFPLFIHEQQTIIDRRETQFSTCCPLFEESIRFLSFILQLSW